MTQPSPVSDAAVEAIDLKHDLPMVLDGPSGTKRANQQIAVLNGVSFAVKRGEWIAITGPSGSGKSTLLGIVAGLESPTNGRVFIDGQDITHMREHELARLRNRAIGVVFQSFNLIPSLSAQENVEVPLYAGWHRRHIARRASEMLDRVGLSDRRRHQPHQLSGGQQQRVAIARALVTQPNLLVADEPTGNLDSRTGAQILDLFSELRRDLNLTVIVVTHDKDIARRADRELHLVDGKLV